MVRERERREADCNKSRPHISSGSAGGVLLGHLRLPITMSGRWQRTPPNSAGIRTLYPSIYQTTSSFATSIWRDTVPRTAGWSGETTASNFTMSSPENPLDTSRLLFTSVRNRWFDQPSFRVQREELTKQLRHVRLRYGKVLIHSVELRRAKADMGALEA
ncbi:hypothetical protein M433DRAFT_138881 [Acidomyces richmondensis BFW]|nr:MAG: hypothetical protein FE78DRAFT_77058 [Acidomyces sp. 'richmondensis']KYG50650.1 hypothetical protein M433DRAFT_138881 [Acidomyces richmondensis BFW]